MDESEKCNFLFRSALWSLNNYEGYPSVFFRELFQSARCDKIHDLSHLRTVVVNDLNDDTVERIVNYNETFKDFRKATQAFYRHREWAQKELSSAISKAE